MAILDILCYPDDRLHRVARPVAQVDDRIQRLIDDMFETMYDSRGIGLAATQVDVHEQVIVIDVGDPDDDGGEANDAADDHGGRGELRDESAEHDDAGLAPRQPLVFINPELIERSQAMINADEGCLSVPTIYDKVPRHESVTVRALDREGKTFELKADGLLAVCIQHEMDHLRGKVFVEYLSALKRDRIKTKMLKKTRGASLR
jgi:peptide deformylase